MFERDASTGMLSPAAAIELNDETVIGTGTIVGMTHSHTTVFVAMAATPTDSSIVVLDLSCGRTTPSPTVSPTLAPTPSPSRAPTPGEVAQRNIQMVGSPQGAMCVA